MFTQQLFCNNIMTHLLFSRSCPSNLEADITRQVLDETKRQYLNPKSMSTQNVDQIDGDASNGLRNHDKSGKTVFQPFPLKPQALVSSQIWTLTA